MKLLLLLTFLLTWTDPAHALTILCLGDSLTEGFGVPKSAAWPAITEKILRDKKHDVTLVNAGISGSTSASGPSRITWHLKSKSKPDWLFLALGANDGLRGQDIKAIRKNIEKTIQIAKDGGVKKIILAGIKVPTNYGPKYAQDFDAMFAMIAKVEKIPFLPFLIEGVAAKPQLNLPDGIHPNVEGHKIVGAHVAKFLETQL